MHDCLFSIRQHYIAILNLTLYGIAYIINVILDSSRWLVVLFVSNYISQLSAGMHAA